MYKPQFFTFIIINRHFKTHKWQKTVTTHWRPPGMQTLTSIRQHGWSGRIASLTLSFFPFLFLRQVLCRTVCRIWNNEGSKRVVPRKGVPFVGLNKVCLNFGGKSPNNWNFGGMSRTFKPKRQKKSNPYNLKIPMHQIWWEDVPRPCGDDHVTNSQNRKLIRVTSSNECREDKCVDVRA